MRRGFFIFVIHSYPLPKILVLRFSSIGDIVLTSPVVRCIKQQVKNAEVHFATKSSFRSLVESNPFIDKVFLLENSLPQLIRQLSAEDYDVIADLHHNQRTLLIKAALGVKSYSFPKLNPEKWLTVRLKNASFLPDIHVVDRYFESVRALGVSNDGKGLDFFIPPADEVSLQLFPEKFRNGYIGFVIGAKYFTKRFPADKIIAVCRPLQAPVLLLGGAEDRDTGDRVAQACGPHVFNACGKYSITQSASLVRQARKIITNDTGLMHIAAAFKKEIISLWGNTIPGFGMGPYYGDYELQIADHKSQVENLSCRPCSKIGFAACPEQHFKCMRETEEPALLKLLQS